MKIDFIKNLIIGLTVTFVFFFLAEIILRATGITPLYERSDPSIGFAGYAPLFEKRTLNNGQEVYTTAPNKFEWFNHQTFPVNKGKDVFRIFCLGGSTTYGRPYDDRTSFSGWLRLFLPAVDSGKHWQVINVGGISYASYRAARLMEELSTYDPDLFIVYSGHNEFLESRTYNDLLEIPDFIRNLKVYASHTRIYSALYDLFYTPGNILPAEVDALLDNSIGPDDYERDDELKAAILEDYEKSLYSMTKVSQDVGASLILVTPASNLADFSPFKSDPSPGLTKEEINKVDSLRSIALEHLSEANYHMSRKLLKQALEIDHRNAEILYLNGRVLHAQDSVEEARHLYIKSRDEDVCPLRALSPVRSILKNVAESEKTGFVDFVSIVNNHSPDGIPGSELFLDHVHPTIEGNRLLAKAIIEEMVVEGIVKPEETWNETLAEEISKEFMNSLDENTHALALRNLSKVLSWAGKHDEAERLINESMAINPDDSEALRQKGRLLWMNGDREGALVNYRQASQMDPFNAGIHRGIGILLSELDRKEEALSELEEALKLDPNLKDIYYDFGVVYQAMGKLDLAENAYLKALTQNPNRAETHNNLGIVYAKSGNLKAAYNQFDEALRLDPDNKEAAINLERAKKVLDN